MIRYYSAEDAEAAAAAMAEILVEPMAAAKVTRRKAMARANRRYASYADRKAFEAADLRYESLRSAHHVLASWPCIVGLSLPKAEHWRGCGLAGGRCRWDLGSMARVCWYQGTLTITCFVGGFDQVLEIHESDRAFGSDNLLGRVVRVMCNYGTEG